MISYWPGPSLCAGQHSDGAAGPAAGPLDPATYPLGQETSADEGTGIGLVVSEQLVELMGGLIGVASTAGVDSEVWIE